MLKLLLIGLAGFSSYRLRTFMLLSDGEFYLALLNMAASNILGLLLVWAGYNLAELDCHFF